MNAQSPEPPILVIATRNAHKVEEIKGILGENFLYRTLVDFPGAPNVVEDATTFAGNATKKAVELAEWLASSSHSLPASAYVLADDSGLEVDALNGAPGVHSARFAALDVVTASKLNSADRDNNSKLLRLLANVPLERRTARFKCVLALVPVPERNHGVSSPACYASQAELSAVLFEGACEGRIAFSPSGQRGFGYDPLFIPDGYQQSFAELGEEIKNRMSHRARALQKMKQWLDSRPV